MGTGRNADGHQQDSPSRRQMARRDFALYDAVHARLEAERDRALSTTTGSTTTTPPDAGLSTPAWLPTVRLPSGGWFNVLEPQARITFFAAADAARNGGHHDELESDFVLFAEHEPLPPPLPPHLLPPLFDVSFTDGDPLPTSCQPQSIAHSGRGTLPWPIPLPPVGELPSSSAYSPVSPGPFGWAPLWLLDPYEPSSSSTFWPSAVSRPADDAPGRRPPVLGLSHLPAPTLLHTPAYAHAHDDADADADDDNDKRWLLPPPVRRQRSAHEMCLPAIKPSPLDPSSTAHSVEDKALQTPPGQRKPTELCWSPTSRSVFLDAVVGRPLAGRRHEAVDEGDIWPFPPLQPAETAWPTPTSERRAPNALGLSLGRPTSGQQEVQPQPQVASGARAPGGGADLMALILDAASGDRPELHSSSTSSEPLLAVGQTEATDGPATGATSSPSGGSPNANLDSRDLHRSLAPTAGARPQRWSRTMQSRLGSASDPIATDRPTSALRLDPLTSDPSAMVQPSHYRRMPPSSPTEEGVYASIGRVVPVAVVVVTPPRRRPPSNEPVRSPSRSDRTESDILMSSSPAVGAGVTVETNAVDGPSVAGLSAPNEFRPHVGSPDEGAASSTSPSPRSVRPRRSKPATSKPKPALRKSTLSAAAVTAFSAWYDAHKAAPYPTAEEKASWVAKFNVTRTQVDDWFINKRRRAKASTAAVGASASGIGTSSAADSARRTLRPR